MAQTRFFGAGSRTGIGATKISSTGPGRNSGETTESQHKAKELAATRIVLGTGAAALREEMADWGVKLGIEDALDFIEAYSVEG